MGLTVKAQGFPPPGQPPGGDPRMDTEFLRWISAFVARHNVAWLDRSTRFGSELPPRELVYEHELAEHLYSQFGLPRTWTEWDLNHNHRLRFLAVEFHRKPRKVKALAESFVARLTLIR
jgi:hypothetical protein